MTNPRLSISLWSALLACFAALPSSAQFTDSFSDGDFTANPAWMGNTATFQVNASQQLQLNDVTAGQSALYTSFPSTTLDDREWNIWVRQTFAGSDNNQSRIYLAANGAPQPYTGAGSAGVQGYFLKLGEGGSSDAIKLCRDNGSGNIVEIASGTPGFIAASFTVRIRVLRSAAGLWTLYADGSGGTNYGLQAQVTDASFTSSSTFAIVCLYTSTYADNFFFDDIYFGDEIVDTTPPELVSVTANSPTTLTAVFNEPMAAGPLTSAANYTVPGIGQPSSAGQVDATTVQLTFASAFPENIVQSLQVSGVTDISGNPIPPTSFSFLWFVPGTATFRDVVFNEVLADPSPEVGLPSAEYVELYNGSDQTFDLSGWQFVNSTTIKTLPSFVLPPGGFVVLCEDDFAASFSPSVGIPSFAALTNDSDSLTLLDNNGTLVDILVYSIDWFDSPEKAAGGWSLEQVNPTLACASADNWRESTDGAGGTPGTQNSVFDPTPDTTAPEFTGLDIVDPSTLVLHFSEVMDAGSTNDMELGLPGFVFSDFSWNAQTNGLQVSVTPALEFGVAYSASLSLLRDCSGNPISPIAIDLILGHPPMPGDVLINEIMADPDPVVQGPAAEYVELYNTTNQLLDLRNCSLNGDAFSSQTLIEPGGYLIVADLSNQLAFLDYPGTAFLEDFPGLTNTGATLTLENGNGELLNEVSYSSSWYGDPSKDDGGWSLEMINPEDPCSDATNWTASADLRGMTAGEQNSVYDTTPDTEAPQFVILLNEPFGSISLIFDEPLDPASLQNFEWEIDGTAQDPGLASLGSSNKAALVLPIDSELWDGIHTVRVQGVADCWGNSVSWLSAVFAVPQEAQPGDLIINEILFDPNTPGQDFVEIYNHSPRPVSLLGWNLSNEDGGIPADQETITEQSVVLLPGQYLVLTEEGHFLTNYYPFTRTDRIWIMENLPSFNVDEGTCYLLMPDGTVSDLLRYTADMHFPLLEDVGGVSLERIAFDRPASDPTNWNSAAESQGFATPGYLNSQAFEAGISEQEISIDPEVFSPDNDGYQDVLTISYTTDEPSLTGNITIYNADGLRVRRLMRNQLLGREGQISWNGAGDEGEALPIGIYVVYFEAFSADGKVSRIKKPCVLAHALGGN